MAASGPGWMVAVKQIRIILRFVIENQSFVVILSMDDILLYSHKTLCTREICVLTTNT